MKIHLVTANEGRAADSVFLVKAHTRAGAEKFVAAKIKPEVTAIVPTQEQLVAALQAGVVIEDATNSPQASIPEQRQNQE